MLYTGLSTPLSPHSVTLTHFSKMQPPVEPTRLPANHIYREDGKEAVRGKGTEAERKGANPGCMVSLPHSMASAAKNVSYYRWSGGETD